MAFVENKKPTAEISCDLCGSVFSIGLAERKFPTLGAEWENVSIWFSPHIGKDKDEIVSGCAGNTLIRHACLSCRTAIKEKFEAIIAAMRTARGTK